MVVQTTATRGAMTRLRQVILADAVIEAMLGAGLVLGAQSLPELMGMGNVPTYLGLGVGMWLYAAWLFRLSRAEPLSRFQVFLVAELNVKPRLDDWRGAAAPHGLASPDSLRQVGAARHR